MCSEKSCHVSSNNSKTSSFEKDDSVNKGTICFATSTKESKCLSSSISTWGQWSGINKPPSLARPCIKTSSKVLLESCPLVL